MQRSKAQLEIVLANLVEVRMAVCRAVAALDSPSVVIGSAESHGIQMMKQGWCAGHLQAMREMILFSQVQQIKTVAFLNGDKNPEQTLTPDVLRQVMAKDADMTCIPNEVNQAQLARILVKWLHDHPERLHEPDYLLTFNAFHESFPCQTDSKKP